MKKKYKWHSYFYSFIFIILSTMSVSSAECDPKNELTMVIMDLVPYGFKSANGKNTGILHDISKRIMLEIGDNQPVKILAIKRISESMNTEKRTCTLVGDTPDALKNWDIIEPIGYQFTIGVLPHNDISLTDYSSLEGLVLAIPLGVSFDDSFDVDKNLSKVIPRNYTNAMKMLGNGQVDAVVGPISTLKFVGHKIGFKEAYYGRIFELHQNNMQLACTHDLSKTLRSKLKNVVVKLKSEGEIRRIFVRYFNNES